jgi:hypothetical protein
VGDAGCRVYPGKAGGEKCGASGQSDCSLNGGVGDSRENKNGVVMGRRDRAIFLGIYISIESTKSSLLE